MFELSKLVRENIKRLKPYSSARHEFTGEAKVFLDANENAFGSPVSALGPPRSAFDSPPGQAVRTGAQSDKGYNRYPDPLQEELKGKLSLIKGVPAQNIFLGNGSDEPIDLLYRAFCNPGKDNVIIVPPTYGMYEVSANINDVEIRKVNLTAEFQLNVEGISEAVDDQTKIIWICSPNNPTGNSIDREDIEFVLNNFNGIVVVDEAYVNYSRQRSMISELTEYPNLVVLQTFSKAWGLAGVRVGMLFASEAIVEIMNKIKPPYNLSLPAQEIAMKALENIEQVNGWIKTTVVEREKLVKALGQLKFVKKIYPSDANFVLVKVEDARRVYDSLAKHGIVVRDRSKVEMCEGCLRITVGTQEENTFLIDALNGLS